MLSTKKELVSKLLSHMLPNKTFDRNVARQILVTSNGMPSPTNKAKFKVDKQGKKTLLRTPLGHSMDHLWIRGSLLAAFINGKEMGIKTSFLRKWDQAEALAKLMNSTQGQEKLMEVCQNPSKRVEILGEIDPIPIVVAYGIGIEEGGLACLNESVLKEAGIPKLPMVAVVEVRMRGNRLYPHVQTFFPKLSREQLINVLKVTESGKDKSHEILSIKPGEYTEEELVSTNRSEESAEKTGGDTKNE